MRQPRERWPDAAHALRDELAGHPGRFALIAGGGQEALVEQLASALGTSPCSVGARLAAAASPPGEREIMAIAGTATLLVDCAILFDPEVAIDPLALFRTLAKRRPIIAVWPGTIEGGWARYSQPGRRDHYEGQLADVLVLRARPTAFPDEVPYTVERVN